MRGNAKRDVLASDPKNLRLVAAIAKSVHARLPPSFDLGDLIAVGNIALVEAAHRYSPKAHGGTPFSAYARKAIRGAMLDTCELNRYLENTRPSIDEPVAQRALQRLATVPGVEMSIDSGRLNRRLEAAIGRLPRAHREILTAAFACGLSIREIGVHFGVTRGVARKLRTEAIAAVRAVLIPGSPIRKLSPERL